MASTIPSDEFPDLRFWTTNQDLDLVNVGDMIYSTSDLRSARSSITSHTPNLVDQSDSAQLYKGFVPNPRTTSSPEQTDFGYQLPSPLEEDIILDPVVVDKERRREQNRVAQRAFRERKECKLKQLEKRIAELKADYRNLEKKHNNLRTAHLRLQSGLKILLDASGTFDDQLLGAGHTAPNDKT